MRFFSIVAFAALSTFASAQAVYANAPPGTPGPTSSYAYYNVTPTQVTFKSSGTQIVGYHYAPANQSGNVPVVLVAHGLGGIQTSRIMPFAARFAAAGYHALTFDYRYWGFSSGNPRNIIDVPSQAADYKAAAEYMKTVAGVDPERIVLWGTSLSGGNVLQIAGQKYIDGLAGTIAQCPEVNGFYTVSFLPPASLPGLVAVGLADNVNGGAEAVGLTVVPPIYIPLANYTGEFGALTQAGAYEGYEFVQPNPPAPGNVFPARFVTQLPFFSPEFTSNSSTVPTFIGVGLTDNIVGFEPQTTLAQEMGADYHAYNGGHFSVYYGADQYDAILADQVAFLEKNVPI
jgi:pimeloyl-ACP methyl ester carboxylesterase